MLLSTIISKKQLCKQAGARKLAAQDQVYTVPYVGKVIATSKGLIIEDAKGNQVVANAPFAIAFNHWLKAGKPGNVFLTSGAHKELEGKGYSLNAVRIPGQSMEGRRARLTPAKDPGFVDLYNKKRNKIPENVWRAVGESAGWLPKTNGGVTFNLQTKTVPAIIPNPIQTPHKATRTSKPIPTPHKATRTSKPIQTPHKPTRRTYTAKPAIKKDQYAAGSAKALLKFIENILYEDVPQPNKINKRIK